MKKNKDNKEFKLGDNERFIKDETELLKKVWETVLPKKFPYVDRFELIFAYEIEKNRMMGPYQLKENKLVYRAKVFLDNQPLIDNGWKGEPVSKEMVKKSYGDDYFDNMRELLIKLAKYVGIDRNNFDMIGDIQGNVEDFKE